VCRLQSGYTPLHLAAQEGHVDMATLLIGPAGKVPVDSAAKNGLTALHVAAQQNHVALAQLLVDHACTVDPRTNVSHLFSGRGGKLPPPLPKNVQFSPKRQAKLCASNRFFLPLQ